MLKINVAAFLLIAVTSNAQFKADNVKYKVVFPEDLCNTLRANKGYLLLDVRSPGEYDDTSSSSGLNIGHLKNAVNINITQLNQRWKEIAAHKDDPVFIYCSHSQRSRRASRLLADSGFTKIYNINGGLTDFYIDGIASSPCDEYQIETSVPYKIVGAKSLVDPKKRNSYYIVDLRSDSVFKGISNERSRLEGRFTDAVNIPFDQFMKQQNFSFSKPVLFVDEFGNESPKAASLLAQRGIQNVSILFDGMYGFQDYVVNVPDKVSGLQVNGELNLVSAAQLYTLMNAQKKFVLLDVRSKEEFSNTSKNYWQNVGQIKGAINIPAMELKTSTALPGSKEAKVIVYGFNNQPEIFESAKWLKDQGYKDVQVLQGGIWRIRWASHNIKGREYLNDLVINVPADNL